jgi:hypothetical protein
MIPKAIIPMTCLGPMAAAIGSYPSAERRVAVASFSMASRTVDLLRMWISQYARPAHKNPPAVDDLKLALIIEVSPAREQ